MSKFEIVRSSPREHRNLTAPAGAALVGTAYQESAVGGVAELADGTKPLAGFVTRGISVSGPSLENDFWPGRLENDFAASKEISLEHAEEIEAEGDDYLATSGGGGQITAGTALGTKLSFVNGKLCVQDGGTQYPFYVLVAKDLTPETEGNLRIRVVQLDL